MSFWESMYWGHCERAWETDHLGGQATRSLMDSSFVILLIFFPFLQCTFCLSNCHLPACFLSTPHIPTNVIGQIVNLAPFSPYLPIQVQPMLIHICILKTSCTKHFTYWTISESTLIELGTTGMAEERWRRWVQYLISKRKVKGYCTIN